MPETIPRGAIRNREYGTQVRDYSGLRFGNITPTDIDGLIEYKNQAYVILELKFKGCPLPYGQRLALERLCDDLQCTKPTLLIIAEHTSTGDIDVTATVAIETRWEGRWHKKKRLTTELISSYIKWLEDVRRQ